jgi:hypothetical protein
VLTVRRYRRRIVAQVDEKHVSGHTEPPDPTTF